MNVHEWHRTGLQPPFATVEQWINDQLGYVGAEDEAVFAVELRSDSAREGLAVRILIATDKGLFDAVWERPDDVGSRRLVARQWRWQDVRDVHLIAETRLDPVTLTHTEPTWRLEVAEPAIALDGGDNGEALLEFWKQCTTEMKKPSS